MSDSTVEPRAEQRTIRPKLLFLCQTLPFPPDSGVNQRSFNIMRLLARTYDVTALCFYRKASRATAASVAAGLAGLRSFARAEAFPIPQEYSRVRLAWDHARSVGGRRVYTHYAYDSRAFRDRLKQLLRDEHFDLVHMDSLDLSCYLPMLDRWPVVCTHHNVESMLLLRSAQAQSSSVKRQYFLMQARLQEREERRWCGQVDLNIAVSRDDANTLLAIVPEARVAVVPSGVDTSVFVPGDGNDDGIVFVGAYGWFPNRDAMLFFSEEVLPRVRSKCGQVAVRWIGRAPDGAKEQFASLYQVELTGYVKDVQPYVHAAACYIAPLRVGGGTRLKILDAWAMGKAVVSTAIGCEGLEAEDGKNILIRNNPDEFADAVVMLLTDGPLRERLGRAARSIAESRYDWNVIAHGMLRHYATIKESFRPQR